jgi:hypothetical protein
VLLVVGLPDQRRVVGHAQRRRLELLQALDGTGDDAVLRALLGRQIEQDDRHLDVDQVGGNLRAHHACAEHGDFATWNRDIHFSPFPPPGGRGSRLLHAQPDLGAVERPDVAAHLQLFAAVHRLQAGL